MKKLKIETGCFIIEEGIRVKEKNPELTLRILLLKI